MHVSRFDSRAFDFNRMLNSLADCLLRHLSTPCEQEGIRVPLALLLALLP